MVLQFSISVGLIIGTAIIYQQFGHLRNINPGFVEEGVVVIPVKGPVAVRYDAFRKELLSGPGIVNVTRMNEILGETHNTYEYNHQGMDPDKWKYFPCLLVDEHFLDVFGMEMVAGRAFSTEYSRDDSLALIINQSLVEDLGWGDPEGRPGQTISYA